jgi:ATP-dependent Clp endopeptidase proteolytic subunit ClpP
MPKKFWNFKNVSNDEAELTIYGYIAMEESWWFDILSSKQFAKDLKGLGKKNTITVKINSGGGDVFAAHAIHNLLKENSAKIVTIVEGIAASAASVILEAGDDRIVPSNAYVMIHNPSSIVFGEAKDMLKMSETLNVIKDGIVNAYVERTGKSKEEISKMMDEETWMTGEDAVKQGFADRTSKDMNVLSNNIVMNNNMLVINSVSHDLSRFKNFPGLKDKIGIEDEEDDLSEEPRAPENKNVQEPLNKIYSNSNPNTNKEEKNIMTLEELKNLHPQLVNQITDAAKEEGKKEGKKEERQRIKEIEEISNSIPADLSKKAKFEEPMNAQELAFLALKNDSRLGNQYLNNTDADSQESGANNIPAAPEQTPAKEEKPESVQDKIKNLARKFDRTRMGVKES